MLLVMAEQKMTMVIGLVLVFFFQHVSCYAGAVNLREGKKTILDGKTQTTTPVIGVLAQPNRWENTTENDSYYIAASYIKWLESAGARTIAIPFEASSDLLDELFTQIHMVFLPGGDAEYPTAMLNYLLDKIRQHNLQGHYFPVWGTCLGFEFLVQYVAGTDTVLDSHYVANNLSLALENVLPLQLYYDAVTYKTVTSTNTTFHNHHNGIQPTTFLSNFYLNDTFWITSTNHDDLGQEFVSSMEPRFPHQFPLYGVQYHPEKNAFEYATYPDWPNVPYQDIDHSPTGVAFSFHLAEFVVQHLARRSVLANPTHQYTLSHRFPPVYTYPQKVGVQFELIYIISKETLPPMALTNDLME